MKDKDMIKLLMPGVIVGLVLGFLLTMLVGVNQENPIPNYIGGAMCCFVPTLLNCIIVLKQTASHLDRKLEIKKAIRMTLPYAVIALGIGFVTVAVIVTKIFGVNTCELSTLVTAIYQAILGVAISTIMAYLASKNYIEQVKYTRKNPTKKSTKNKK